MNVSLSSCSLDKPSAMAVPRINPNISSMLKNQVLFFTGYPGSGKGTQGKPLAKEWNIVHLSTGELFRAEAEKKTEIGLAMGEYMDRGEVIPKELVFPYLEGELANPKYQQGFILDGYPKSLEFYDHLMALLPKLGLEPFGAIYFEISKETAVQRLTGRSEGRSDDNEKAIQERLKSFDDKTGPVIAKFEEEGLLFTIDASRPPSEVREEIISTISRVGLRRLQETGSYFLREPHGPENSSVFHNHIDAQSFGVLHQIIQKVESISIDFQDKIYPVSHLYLGPQVEDPEFASVYLALPNFHRIRDSREEAFSTGKMGDDGFNYEQIRATLETVSGFPDQGVMTELEEDIFSQEFDSEGYGSITLDRGFTPFTIDWPQLPGWREKMIADIPRFELHHAFDIKKGEDEKTLPIDLATLSARTTGLGFQTGGWFVFRKKNHWSYRSNQFSNGNYESDLNLLKEQALRLRELVAALLLNQPFTSGCSLEKVHAIWRV